MHIYRLKTFTASQHHGGRRTVQEPAGSFTLHKAPMAEAFLFPLPDAYLCGLGVSFRDKRLYQPQTGSGIASEGAVLRP